ncbi:MAG TPA: hypothetical protein GXZ48_01595, partial [Acholeplasmataceae bacterium]|nr:hypothetical protein [Acholeplasmataceae bacterium]
NFPEIGEEFQNELNGLDIVGENSLYQYLNICKTKNSKRKLVERLTNPANTKEELKEKQMIIKELSEKINFSLEFQVALKEYYNESKNFNLNYIINFLQKDIKFSNIHLYVVIGFIFLTVITFFLAIFNSISWNYFLSIFVIQFLYSSLFRNFHRDEFAKIQDVSLTIVLLENIFQVIASENFTNENLQNYQNNIKIYGLKGITGINKVKNIESYNQFFITYIILNGLFSLNIILIKMFKDYINEYGKVFLLSVEALEQFEVNGSLAIIGQVKQNISMPEYVDEVKLKFTELRHPLIPEGECVPNSFNLEENMNIITGSNMSGKTSFLRTIGINLILMNAGTFVNGLSFQSTYLKIFTSMRITDDLNKGISTFYAELLNIKKAIDYAKENKPMIVLIDEIFKGTNSNDRIKGAISLIERLNNDKIILFISTHDFELCNIETLKLKNYHFTEHYFNNQIHFDYKLREGKCKTTNAQYLMKLVGIIE